MVADPPAALRRINEVDPSLHLAGRILAPMARLRQGGPALIDAKASTRFGVPIRISRRS